MTDNWKILDLNTHKYLSEIFTDVAAVNERIKMLEESVPNANLIPQMFMVPDKQFSVYYRMIPKIGKPYDWHFYMDYDTIAAAVERIIHDMDADDEDSPCEYKIVFTVSPDMVVLTMKPGDFYPHVKEDEK